MNRHDYSILAEAPLLPLLGAVTSFFSSFAEPALSPEAGAHLAATYHALPFEATNASEPQQFADAFAVGRLSITVG